MKAVRYHSYGGTEVLALEDAPWPVAGPGQVVVQVAGTSFNFLDIALRSGMLTEVMPLDLPHTPGIDVAGVIAETGPGVTGWKPGDAVVALLPNAVPGAAAEYVAVPAEALAAAPTAVPLADAAALPAVGLTARQALVEDLDLQAGQRLFINGAGGAVGGYAIQLAKRAGAVVTATASPRSRDRVEAAGADRIVDHTREPVLDALHGERFDAVLQLVRSSPEDTAALVDLVADGGAFTSTTTPGPERPGRGVRVGHVYVRGEGASLAELVALVDVGELHVDVAERLPIADTAALHDRAVAGEVSGKVVLTP
ncbi:NADP-dependent oxidoreductase [Glycomyces terrestris]|uniref:NADP-dependent oxidoreductase n=1 Tax=Glycomyces terrestris TaxID=2493553 RepID=A0A426URX1_9ACTN|nr:NADP-dependent oxidoreductase [Glycomyces terrestris]RRR96048.1 NADP-dependent oxidoreductase [Glycomyces terrestris]